MIDFEVLPSIAATNTEVVSTASGWNMVKHKANRHSKPQPALKAQLLSNLQSPIFAFSFCLRRDHAKPSDPRSTCPCAFPYISLTPRLLIFLDSVKSSITKSQ